MQYKTLLTTNSSQSELLSSASHVHKSAQPAGAQVLILGANSDMADERSANPSLCKCSCSLPEAFPGYLEQGCLAEDTGQGVELPHEQPQLVHRQLVLTLPSPGAVPAMTPFSFLGYH